MDIFTTDARTADLNQLGDEPKTFVWPVRCRRQSEVDQRKLRSAIEPAKQACGLRTRIGDMNIEVAAEHVRERIRDQRIVINQEQIRFCSVLQDRSPTFGSTRLFCQSATSGLAKASTT